MDSITYNGISTNFDDTNTYNKNNNNLNEIQTASNELERVYASIGDTINLTCYLYTKEVDWHFKDKNLTTTIISNGLQLQVTQQALHVNDITNENRRLKHRAIMITNNNKKRLRHDRNRNTRLLKYKVTSDLHFTHMLGVYVQGEQDEGSYQCIDSVSESPVKKTIVVILSEFLFLFLFF